MSAKTAFRRTSANTGLETFLPSAEAEIMRILWTLGPLKVRAIHKILLARREIAYTTVMTTCVRLHDKGHLQREIDNEQYGYIYTPVVDEQTFIANALASVFDLLAQDYPTVLADYLATHRRATT